jgi:hypothetical protein
MLTEVYGGRRYGPLSVNNTPNKIRQRCYWLQARNNVGKLCRQCDIHAASRGPRTRNRGQMHQYNVEAPFERIYIDVAAPYPGRDQENLDLLIAMDYFTKWPEAYAIPNQEASTVEEALVTNFFCRLGVPRELHGDHGRNFEYRSIEEVLQRLGVRRAPHPYTHNRTAWLSAASKRSRSTCEKLSHPTRGIGMQDYPSSSLLTGHPLTIIRARPRWSSVRKRTPTVLRPAVWDTPRQGTTHIRLAANLHDMHSYSRHHPKLASDRMKTSYDWLANCACDLDGDDA